MSLKDEVPEGFPIWTAASSLNEMVQQIKVLINQPGFQHMVGYICITYLYTDTKIYYIAELLLLFFGGGWDPVSIAW